MKDMELDASSMEKRFAYKFLKKILKYVDSAQEFIAHLGKYSCKTSGKKVVFLWEEWPSYEWSSCVAHDSLRQIILVENSG